MPLSESPSKGRSTNDLGDIKTGTLGTDPKEHYERFHRSKSEFLYQTQNSQHIPEIKAISVPQNVNADFNGTAVFDNRLSQFFRDKY